VTSDAECARKLRESTDEDSAMSGHTQHWRPRLARLPLGPSLLVLAACAALTARALGFYPFMADDAFISLRYAQRLMDGHGLTWTDGVRVEGYSNLLWVLACALLGAFGVDLVVAARVLGLGATLATVAVLAWTCRARPLLACGAALAAFALAGPVAAWSMAGLEQPMLALWLALGLCFVLPIVDDSVAQGRSRPGTAGVCFGLAALTRPDGLLLGVGVGVVLLLSGRPRANRLRQVVRFAVPFVALVVAQLAFRLAYYHDFIPNTGHAKLALSPAHVVRGSFHVWDGLVASRSVFLVMGLAFVLCTIRGRQTRLALFATPMVMWLGYLALVGGDIFPAWRQFVPALVPAALLIGEGVAVALDGGPTWRWVMAVVLANAFFLGVHDQKHDQRLAYAKSERWEWDGEVVGRFLADAFSGKAPLLAVDPAGAVPFFSRLPALDMLGLNDRFLATHPPADFGQSTSLGHELGNGPYVLDRRPDLVLFCLPEGSDKPCFRGGKELVALDGFRDAYQLVTFEGRRPHTFRTRMWVRRASDKIGMRQSPGRVVVPGFLVGDADGTWSFLDNAGKLVTEIPPRAQVVAKTIQLPAGAWKVSAGVTGGDLVARVVAPLAEAGDSSPFPLSLPMPADGAIDLVLDNRSDQPAWLEQLVFEAASAPH
jgi:arabinofuranosyltransferase